MRLVVLRKVGKVGMLAGVAVIVALVGLAAYVLLVLRRCDHGTDVRRGSFDYRLCGIGGDLIAQVPIVAATGEPTYSWRLAEGTKTGYEVVKYESADAPAAVRMSLADFLRRSGFSATSTDADREWWGDRKTQIGLSVRGVARGSQIEVLHDTGND